MDTQFGRGIATDEDGRAAAVRAARDALAEMDTDRVDFCHVFCSSRYRYEAVLSGVREVVGDEATLLGASSAGEFSDEAVVEGGVAVALLTSDNMAFAAGMGTGLRENLQSAVGEALTGLPGETKEFPYLFAVSVHDGLAGVGERLALLMQRKLGPHVNFAGGSASRASEADQTAVFCDGTVASDAIGIALIGSQERPIITVNHGHRPISGPLEVTASDGNVVAELDGEPAFDAWRDVARENVLDVFDVTVEEFENDLSVQRQLIGDTGFGIDQGDGYKVRGPWVEDQEAGSIGFSVEVPEGTVLRVMCSGPDDQVDAAHEVATEAVELADGREMAGAFVYDCVCRRSILGDRFGDAVAAMDEAFDVPFTGFATFGEMAMQMGQTSGYHNTTTVALLLPK